MTKVTDFSVLAADVPFSLRTMLTNFARWDILWETWEVKCATVLCAGYSEHVEATRMGGLTFLSTPLFNYVNYGYWTVPVFSDFAGNVNLKQQK